VTLFPYTTLFRSVFAGGALLRVPPVNSGPEAIPAAAVRADPNVIDVDAGTFRFTVDTSGTPDLTGWAQKDLAPVLREWYPKIVGFLTREDFEAPEKFSVTFDENGQGVAGTAGTRIFCAAKWYRESHPDGEAIGSVVHEMIHVIQLYPGDVYGKNGWLVEGIADYIRFFIYAQEEHGADLVWISKHVNGCSPQSGDLSGCVPHYNGSYRESANFLDWVSKKYDGEIVAKLNYSLRADGYDAALWRQYTGHSIAELEDEWRKEIRAMLGAPRCDPLN
jgi:hypothetical protein